MGFFSFNMVKEVDKQFELISEALQNRRFVIEPVQDQPDQASIVCEDLRLLFWRDRNLAIFCYIYVPSEEPEGEPVQIGTSLAAKFASLPQRKLQEDQEGRITESPASQVRSELEILNKLSSKVLFDLECRRKLVWFYEGYTVAYNEWAAGEWNFEP